MEHVKRSPIGGLMSAPAPACGATGEHTKRTAFGVPVWVHPASRVAFGRTVPSPLHPGHEIVIDPCGDLAAFELPNNRKEQ